jgi:hypothetical protein
VRLGELLLADGLIAPDELETAIAQHRRSGVRLGASLYLSGRVTADAIARALARQHGVPAALVRHLDGRDPTLASRIPGELARRTMALPVALSKGRAEAGDPAVPALVVCMRDPGDAAAVAAITRAAGGPVIPAVACEAVLAAHVARAYPPGQDGDENDSVDVVFDEISGTYSAPLDVGDPLLMLVDLDDKRVDKDFSQTGLIGTSQRLTPVSGVPATGATDRSSRPSGGFPPVTAAGTTPPPARDSAPPARDSAPPARDTAPARPAPLLDVDAAIAALASAPSRDAVGDIAIGFLRGAYAVGAVLLVRDNLALGHRGFGGSLTPATVESMVVPLHLPSVLRVAHDSGRPHVGPPPADAGTVQERFLRLLGSPREVVVVPVVLRDRPVCLVFAAEPLASADDALDDLRTVVAAMEEAYLRLIRDAKKAPGAITPPVEPG